MSEQENMPDWEEVDEGQAHFERLDRLADEGQETVKQPGVDQKGQDSSIEIPDLSSAEFFQVTLKFLASSLAPNWQIPEAELDKLGTQYGKLLDKYVPNAGEMLGVEMTAIILTVGVVAPRVMAGIPRHAPPAYKATAEDSQAE